MNREQMNFKTKGKWYLAADVDAAMHQLTAEREDLSRELNAIKNRMQQLREETESLKAELQRRESGAVPESHLEKSILHQKKVREELEMERDDLIKTIRTLRQLRDTFQASIRQDAQNLTNQLNDMESKGIL